MGNLSMETLRGAIDEDHIRRCFRALYSTDDEEEARRRMAAEVRETKRRRGYPIESEANR